LGSSCSFLHSVDKDQIHRPKISCQPGHKLTVPAAVSPPKSEPSCAQRLADVPRGKCNGWQQFRDFEYMTTKSNILESGPTAGFTRPFAGALLEAPAAGDCGGLLPEFGRVRDVERIFGIKRGILYRKIADGSIRSVSLREPGKKFGCRLIHMASVRDWLHREMESQNGESS